jgi:hypothetical protein
MVKSLTAERDQIDIALTALNKIATVESGNRQLMTGNPGTGISVATTNRNRGHASNRTVARKRATTKPAQVKPSEAA